MGSVYFDHFFSASSQELLPSQGIRALATEDFRVRLPIVRMLADSPDTQAKATYRKINFNSAIADVANLSDSHHIAIEVEIAMIESTICNYQLGHHPEVLWHFEGSNYHSASISSQLQFRENQLRYGYSAGAAYIFMTEEIPHPDFSLFFTCHQGKWKIEYELLKDSGMLNRVLSIYINTELGGEFFLNDVIAKTIHRSFKYDQYIIKS